MRTAGAMRVGWLLVLAVAACGRAPAPEQPSPARASAVEAARTASRPAVEPVPVPPGFEAAVEAGTRTLTGRPGPRYWQQEVDYRISAELNPETARLQGSETVVYRNHSPDTLDRLVFHLYQNLFREGEPRNRQVPITGGMTVERVAVNGREARQGRGPEGTAAYAVDGTLMQLRLPEPLESGDSVVVEVEWSFVVPPRGAPRMGHIDREVFNVAQWYPQVATYDDVRGWHVWPYLGDGEFYLEYGDFDVEITVPEGWLVAASGTLQNPGDVLPEAVRRRLDKALASDAVVSVVSEEELGPGTATRRAPSGQLTWRFRAEDVRDFAFATSDRYVWDATRAVSPDADGDGEEEVVAVHAFYRPMADAWREAARYTRHAVEFHARHWHPYIYPQITSVEGPIGGMEYPMIVFVRAFPNPRTLYTVINHEVAHEWYPMMAGSKEPEFAWQDEGLVTYIENLATMDFFPEYNPFTGEMRQYLFIAGTEYEKPMMRHADLYGPGPARVIASYRKPGFMLRALGRVIGEDTLHRALAEYSARWHLKHPMALDFFNTVEDVAGRDLDWFWHPWWYETATLDQAITGVELAPSENGEQVAVTVEDQGEAPMPVELVVTTADGEAHRVTVPVDVWLAGARTHTETIQVDGRVQRIAIDPDEFFPDVDREDNVWTRSEASTP